MARNWKSKKDRQDAVGAFLQKTLTDPETRSSVLKDRKTARMLLEKEGGISLPDDVEVICVGPSTEERERLVVLMLPPEGSNPESLDPFKYWLAAWVPYAFETGPSAPSARAKLEMAEASL